MQTVQFALADGVYSSALRAALGRSGPWHVVGAEDPNSSETSVLVMDEDALNRSTLPLHHPERIVLITRKDPQHLSRAWDAGIVSVVSMDDALDTVLLAIMASALRISKAQAAPSTPSGISPTHRIAPAPLSPEHGHPGPKRCKIC
jgi:hypothetical protein